MRHAHVWLAVAGMAAACGAPAGPEDQGPGGPGGGDPDNGPGTEGCEKVDFVFVIDDSGSMREEQGNLAQNFPLFASVIDQATTASGAPLDYRLAVTTAGRDVEYRISNPFGGIEFPMSELGANGEFQMKCGMTRRWIEKADPDVAGTFSCVAQLGNYGPGAEMPLLGLEWALGRRVEDGTNAGFLRDDALLAVVILTDQDDCSREDDGFLIDGSKDTCFDPADPNILPLDHYLSFLDTLKGDRLRWATAVIAGPGPGQCQSQFGYAAEAVRMKDFVTQTGENAVLGSICDGDLTGALDQAVGLFGAACDSFPLD